MTSALIRAGTFVALLGLIATAVTSAAGARTRVPVFFLQGEQMVRIPRQGASAADAVRQLIAGPTRQEVRRGVRTYVPRGTALRKLRLAGRLATVDLSTRFTTGGNADSLTARLAQLVRTLAANGAARVQLLVDGRKVSGVFPGVPTEAPITLRYLQTPTGPVPKPPPARRGRFDPGLQRVQRRLITLGYLPAGSADGQLGPMTQEAILAFQKWERLDRTGVLDDLTKARLPTATRPTPKNHAGAGRRAEVLLDRQVTLLIDNDRVVTTIAVSTGKPSTPTPPGHYKVYAKIPRWWSTPFREWLPWAVPFVGGIAFHEFLVVPAYAASHGCVRQVPAIARRTFDFASVGMPVAVIARS